ncbi:MAG TPA: thioredoxin domain-containing protein [Candidatus Sulfotelmatobacter sp.]|nr:thioredoxin domain-containing protein [Candidatus Sulfotelmatobacter sp.]
MFAQNDPAVVAEVGGVKVTMAELEKEESAKLLAAHYTYYQAETKALEDLVDKRLIEQKAKSEHLTVDQLMDRDIKSKVTDPTEDQMKVYYEGLETEQPYEQVRQKILDKIRELRTNKIKADYVRELRAHTTVYIALAPPRAEVETAGSMTLGSNSAQVTLVEFADYECPYCQKVAADLKKIKDDFGDKVSLTYKDFPLPMHSRAEKAAEAARCANKQNRFWEFHDEIFHSKELDLDQLKAQARALNLDVAQFDKCLDTGETASAVDKDRKEGTRLGITGTPAFFVNGHYLSGALDYAALRKVVEQQMSAPSAQATANSGGK